MGANTNKVPLAMMLHDTKIICLYYNSKHSFIILLFEVYNLLLMPSFSLRIDFKMWTKPAHFK